jgi:pectin methylesterase-like acyl-CoA thioesterase
MYITLLDFAKRTSEQRRANPACGKPTFVERPNVGAEKSLSEMASCPPPPEAGPVDIVVAQDGSGQFTNITSALESLAASAAINGSSAAASGGGLRRIIVYIKQGIYDESFEVPRSLVNLTLVGDGAGATIVTGNKSVGSGLFNTLRTATVGRSESEAY